MKLYATTTSERASKGQGGNDYLDIDITVKDLEVTPLTFLRVEQQGDCYVLKNRETGEIYDSKPIENQKLLQKGKSQKGESGWTCYKCKSINHNNTKKEGCYKCGFIL